MTAILYGQSRHHLSDFGQGVFLHKEMLSAFKDLCAAAKKDGIELRVASGFRDFSAQLKIWNLKASGKRPLFDASGSALDYASLSQQEIVKAILRWSALPGASRHHWGTDFDVFDGKSLSNGYKVQLIPSEAEPGAPFHHLSEWLSENLSRFHFFKPYAHDQGGVSPEWWHLSYAPLSQTYLKAYCIDSLREILQSSALELKDIVLASLAEIFDRYIKNITPP